MQVRAARTLIFIREHGEIIGFNYLFKRAFSCSHDLLTFLSMIEEWTELRDVVRKCPTIPRTDLIKKLESLEETSAIVRRESEEDEREAAFCENWDWGVPAALFHMTVQDRPFMSLADSTAHQRRQLEHTPTPSLYTRACELGERESLALEKAAHCQLLDLMAKRRTVRTASRPSVSLDDLSDCLFAGLGITGFTKNEAGVELPLAMTPSGGARNPFEAFVCARSVDGLDPGFYHYSAHDHCLSRLRTNELPNMSRLLGGQEWADEMPAMILLCANFQRSMWKYKDANAYRVLLIEAGHIGQNIMLLATERGLTACPSAALDHELIARCLGLDETFLQAPIYALALAHPGKADPISHHHPRALRIAS